MFAHRSQIQIVSSSRFTGRRSPMIPAALIILFLLACTGCGESTLYVVTDEPNGTAVAGITLTDAEVDTLASSEAEARAFLLAGEYAQAAEAFKKQLPILEKHFITEYKVGAAYAHAGDVEQSLAWLEQSANKGFANVGKMDNDPALELLHGETRAVPIYRKARENMSALRSLIQLDPWAGTSGTVQSYNDLPSLLSVYQKEKERVKRLQSVFFPREATLRLVITDRSKAEALEAFIAAHQDDETAEEARIELIRLYRQHTQGASISAVAQAKLDEGCRGYLNDYPQGRFLAEVKLLHAEYRFLNGLRGLGGPRREEIPGFCNGFRAEAEAIVSDFPGTPAAGQALIWLTSLSFDPRYGQRDLENALERYRQLQQDYFSLPDVAELANGRLPALRFFDDGVPAFEVEGIDGQTISLAQYEGKVLILFFWSTTSKPAKDEIANLKWIEEKFQDKEIAVAGVSIDKGDLLSKSDFTRWVEANSVSWPQYYDGKGTDNQLARLFGVTTAPYVFVINRDGSLADAGLTGKDLELAVAGILD